MAQWGAGAQGLLLIRLHAQNFVTGAIDGQDLCFAISQAVWPWLWPTSTGSSPVIVVLRGTHSLETTHSRLQSVLQQRPLM